MSQPPPGRPRLLVYCHNVLGLGHVVRCLRLAGAALDHGLDTALITGCPFVDELPLPAGLRLERLPAAAFRGGMLRGRDDGDPEVMARREAMILDFARQWRPDGILVDHLALGLAGEMTSTLLTAQDESWPARIFWGVRDVTADPTAGQGPPAPRNPRLRRALESFSGVLVYSSPGWLDGLDHFAAYPLPAEVERVGIIAEDIAYPAPAEPGLVAALAGGGSGAARMLDLVRAALDLDRLPQNARVRLITGPYADVSGTADDPRLEVLPRGRAEDETARAAVVVCRAGYNTAYAAVASDRPVVLIPLANEGGEQPYRARRLAELEGVYLVDENAPDAASSLADALSAALERGLARRNLPFDLDGASRAGRYLARRLAEGRAA